MSFKGFVEASNGNVLSGWAVDEEGEACALTLAVNNGEPVTIESALDRPDLVKLGISAGKGGFTIDADPLLIEGDNIIELRFPNGTPVPGSPLFRSVGAASAVEQNYRGYVENCEPKDVRGWAINGAGLPCVLTVTVNGKPIVEGVSDRPRPDLERQNISNGLGGFAFDITPFLTDEPHTVAVTFGDGSHVRGSPFETGKPLAEAVESPPEEMRRSAETSPPPRAASAKMPSLAELDELSLDDLSLAVASGMVDVPAVEAPPLEVEPEAEPAQIPERVQLAGRPSFLKRLFGTRR